MKETSHCCTEYQHGYATHSSGAIQHNLKCDIAFTQQFCKQEINIE